MITLPIALYKQYKVREWRSRLAEDAVIFCPVCGSFGKQWLPFGRGHKTRCPVCGCLGRHRHLFWRLCEERLFIKSPKILHVAPEPLFRNMFRAIGLADYYDCDIIKGRARLTMDITDIRFPPDSFDVIICNHVLEHILDDAKAVREFARVLKPDGAAFITVPILYPEATVQDDTADTPEKRLKSHGQFDHVRAYGRRGFHGLLNDNGLEFDELSPTEFAHDFLLSKSLLEDTIYKCRKA